MAASTSTSFQKKSRSKITQIPGTRASLNNNQLLISTGIPSLDAVIGGGLAIGTVLMIEEDLYGSYAKVLLRYFLSEGVTSQHGILLACADVRPEDFMKELPAPILDDPGGDTTASEGDKMTIAWRYQKQPKVQSNTSSAKFGNYYDLTKTIDPAVIDRSEKHTFYLPEESTDTGEPGVMNPTYQKLLGCIQCCIERGQYGTTSSIASRNVLRIAIQSLGSPLWGEMGGIKEDQSHDPSLPRFLYSLRSLLRTSYAACVITVPSHLFHDESFVRRIEKLSDIAVHLDSFVGSDKEKNPAFQEYHGLFSIRQLPRLNSLTCHMPESLDLAFKLRRKKFMIEKLHLPPELSETVSRTQEDPLQRTGCGTSQGKNKLDF